MAIPRNLKKRALNIIRAVEKRNRVNNWYVFWEDDEEKPNPKEKSLVIVLTHYNNDKNQ